MNVKNLYPCQLEELRNKIDFADTVEHLNDVGADTSRWTDGDFRNWICGEIPDALVIKSFEGYDFHCDDFFCTAGKYDEYPDREMNYCIDVLIEMREHLAFSCGEDNDQVSALDNAIAFIKERM